MQYDSKACNQFIADMGKAGLEVRHYEGRFLWQGPAIVVPPSQIPAIKKLTEVKLQMDEMGRYTVIYPVASGRLIKNEGQTTAPQPERKGRGR